MGTTNLIDYRKIHRPAGQLFTAATRSEEIPKYTLSPEQVRFYETNGYLKGIRVLEERQLQCLRDRLEQMVADDFPRRSELIGLTAAAGGASKNQQMIYFQGAWFVDDAFHDLLFNAEMTVPLSQLLGTNRVRFWHDQLFYKPARHGGVVAWHQDYSYWTRTVPVGHITCFVALDDTTLENGCVHVVPGSHRWNLLPTVKLTGGMEDMEAIKQVLSPEQLAQFKPVPMMLKAGEASFHHCLTLHGSYPNTSPNPRRGVVLNFIRPDVRSDTDKPLMPGTPPIPKGAVVEGENFPIVFDANQLTQN